MVLQANTENNNSRVRVHMFGSACHPLIMQILVPTIMDGADRRRAEDHFLTVVPAILGRDLILEGSGCPPNPGVQPRPNRRLLN
ncbi:hypothetical protein DdX_04133 [Ditylenchus destructor]|uniref:Uncharacterized protein n=1 Tax=Ditylenchus destructor TaxID=166010 RepID=A0AAD4ND91_9BILA|nr:hypothetical protein DdX_04133 [Ditylenchus destructor]